MLAERISSFIDWVARSPARKEGYDNPALEGYDDPASDDLAYEDALFNAQLRSFFHNEYGSVQPPHGSFHNVLNAIERREEQESEHRGRDRNYGRLAAYRHSRNLGKIGVIDLAAQLEPMLIGLRRMRSRADMSHILSGSLAMALLILAMSSNLTGILNSGVSIRNLPGVFPQKDVGVGVGPNPTFVPSAPFTPSRSGMFSTITPASSPGINNDPSTGSAGQADSQALNLRLIEVKTGEYLDEGSQPAPVPGSPNPPSVEPNIANQRNYQ